MSLLGVASLCELCGLARCKRFAVVCSFASGSAYKCLVVLMDVGGWRRRRGQRGLAVPRRVARMLLARVPPLEQRHRNRVSREVETYYQRSMAFGALAVAPAARAETAAHKRDSTRRVGSFKLKLRHPRILRRPQRQARLRREHVQRQNAPAHRDHQ